MTLLTVIAVFVLLLIVVESGIGAVIRAGKVRRLTGEWRSRKLCPRPRWLNWLQTWLLSVQLLPENVMEQARVGLGLIDEAEQELGWLQAVGFIAGAVVGCLVVMVSQVGWGLGIAVVCVLMLAGICGPVLYLARRCRMRTEQAAAEMGDFLELSACCTEAGMPLLSTLELVAGKMSGVLAGELRMALHRSGALGGVSGGLTELSARLDHPLIRMVVSTLVQAERMGTPLARLLRRHQRTVVTMRRQSVLRRIAEANNRLTLCAIFLLLPATLAVAIIPNVIGLLHSQW